MKKFLFLIDLDGTLLDDSITSQINNYSKKVIQKIILEGHIVCVVTGRPWRSTVEIYEELGLNTIIGNYNGAFIHNPKDPGFIPRISGLSLRNILYIKEDEQIRERIENFAIEGLNWIQMERDDLNWRSLLALDKAQKYKIGPVDFKTIVLKPISGLLNLRLFSDEVNGFQKYLKTKYSDIADFPVLRQQDNPYLYTFSIVPKGISKANVLSILLRYYNFSIEDVVTFGDGYNDLEIFENSFISVAVANAEKIIKKSATFVSKFTNKEGAVGLFIEEFLANPNYFLNKAKELHSQKLQNEVAFF